MSSATVCSTITRGSWNTASPLAMPVTSFRPDMRKRPGAAQAAAAGAIDQPRAGDQLGQHHRHGLQRLDLDILIAARLGVLDCEHPDRAFEADDRHAGEAVEALLAGFGPVGEGGMIGGLGEVEDASSSAIVPTSPSPMRSLVTWTASLRSPWVANSSSTLSRSR